MGIYASHFQAEDGKEVARKSRPDMASWITAHAIATELSIAEVERLWLRFQQLGCNTDGVLTKEVLESPSIASDAFVKNILKNFKDRTPSGSISFENFLKAMRWCELAEMEHKLKAIFGLLNNGNPLNKDMLTRIMKRVYPDDDEAAIGRTVNVLLEQLDDTRSGQINEEQFMRGVGDLQQNELAAIVQFEIFPPDMRDEFHRSIPEFSRQLSDASISQQQSVPSDQQLTELAKKIHRRDWELVANKLGFFNEDVQAYRDRYSQDTQQQVYQMLLDWKERDVNQAKTHILEKAVRDVGMADVAYILTLR